MESNRPMAHVPGAWNPQLMCTLVSQCLPDCLDDFLASCSLTPAPRCLAFPSLPTTSGSSTQGSNGVLLAGRGLPSALTLHPRVDLWARGELVSGMCPAASLDKARQCLFLPWASSTTHVWRVTQWGPLTLIQVPRVSLQRGYSPSGSDSMGRRDWLPHLGPLISLSMPHVLSMGSANYVAGPAPNPDQNDFKAFVSCNVP